GDDLRRLVDVARVQVGHLRLGDPVHLLAREAAHFGAVRLARALVEPQRLLDQDGGRRRLRDEREGAILEDGDLDRGDAAVLVGCLRVERLAELHDVDPVLAERGTGVAPAPTKPVTPGVFFTTVQASSLRSMFTST